MARISRQFFIKFAYIFIDVGFIALAIFLACWLRKDTLPFPITLYHIFLNPDNPYRYVSVFWILVVIFINNTYGLYHTKREIVESVEVWQVIKSILLSGLVTIVALYVLKIEDYPRSVLFLIAGFLIAFFSLWRILKRIFVTYLVIQGYNNFNALVIGAGKVGAALTKEIESRPGLGINVVGFLDDFKTESPLGARPKILGKITDLPQVVRREFINKIYITIHHDSKVFMQILEQAKEIGLAVLVVPQGFELMPGEFYKYNIGFVPILEYSDVENIRKQHGKRLFDFFVSTFALILLSPVFLVISFFIKLDSPGPVFYISRRFGQRGRILKMYKFRSMVQDADKVLDKLMDVNEVDGPIFKIKKDPRITDFGRILRKYSLDELPQLFNVWKGNMSLVGPRPLPINQVEREDLKQLKRLEIRPGITGLWQIRGRSDISFSRLVKWDVWYINNWSFWLDLNILVQTVPAVLRGKGAY